MPDDQAVDKEAQRAARPTADGSDLQLKQAEARLAQSSTSSLEDERLIRTLTELIVDCGRAYRDSDDETRRAYNQAWFERILIDVEGARDCLHAWETAGRAANG